MSMFSEILYGQEADSIGKLILNAIDKEQLKNSNALLITLLNKYEEFRSSSEGSYDHSIYKSVSELSKKEVW